MATIQINSQNQQVQTRQITGFFAVFKSKKGNLTLAAEGRFYNSNIPIADFLKQCGLPENVDLKTINFKGVVTYVNRNMGTQESPEWRSFIRQLDGEVVQVQILK